MGKGNGAGRGAGNACWSLIWLLILIFFGFWLAGFCAGFHILFQPFAACIEGCGVNIIFHYFELQLGYILTQWHLNKYIFYHHTADSGNLDERSRLPKNVRRRNYQGYIDLRHAEIISDSVQNVTFTTIKECFAVARFSSFDQYISGLKIKIATIYSTFGI